jgi:excisionase family DNA binding protein
MRVELINVTSDELQQIIRRAVREELERIEQLKPKPIKLHSSKEVMKILNISESTFRRFVKGGSIPAVKVKGRVHVKDEELRKLLQVVKTLKYKRK